MNMCYEQIIGLEFPGAQQDTGAKLDDLEASFVAPSVSGDAFHSAFVEGRQAI